LHIGAAGVGGEHQRASGLFLPQQCQIATVNTRCMGFSVQRIAVIPHCDQPQQGRRSKQR
jgi:hypothetical protein